MRTHTSRCASSGRSPAEDRAPAGRLGIAQAGRRHRPADSSGARIVPGRAAKAASEARTAVDDARSRRAISATARVEGPWLTSLPSAPPRHGSRRPRRRPREWPISSRWRRSRTRGCALATIPRCSSARAATAPPPARTPSRYAWACAGSGSGARLRPAGTCRDASSTSAAPPARRCTAPGTRSRRIPTKPFSAWAPDSPTSRGRRSSRGRRRPLWRRERRRPAAT